MAEKVFSGWRVSAVEAPAPHLGLLSVASCLLAAVFARPVSGLQLKPSRLPSLPTGATP